MRLVRLTQDHVFKPFDCGVEDLNDFLLSDSKDYLHSKTLFITNNRTGCTFVTVDALREAIPFYVSNGFVVMDKKALEDEAMETCPLYYNLFELVQ